MDQEDVVEPSDHSTLDVREEKTVGAYAPLTMKVVLERLYLDGNVQKEVIWAFTQKQRLLFLPDQHLGRNTAYDLGISLHEMVVWDPLEEVIVNEYQASSPSWCRLWLFP